VLYDGTDYVRDCKQTVKALLEEEFEDARVYLADLETIPTFGAGGTFCIEALSSGVETAAGALGQVLVTLRIWTYAEEVEGERAEEAVSSLAQKLEGVLLAATRTAPAAGRDWLATEYLETTYLPREKGRTWRRRYLRAGRTDWRVRLAACR